MQRFKKVMRATQGALIVASTIQIVLGFSGLWRNVARCIPLSYILLGLSMVEVFNINIIVKAACLLFLSICPYALFLSPFVGHDFFFFLFGVGEMRFLYKLITLNLLSLHIVYPQLNCCIWNFL